MKLKSVILIETFHSYCYVPQNRDITYFLRSRNVFKITIITKLFYYYYFVNAHLVKCTNNDYVQIITENTKVLPIHCAKQY